MRFRRSASVFGFISLLILTAGVWVLKHLFHVHLPVFDAPPFILLNLILSMLAGLQGAILLIAAKRQDAVAAAMAEHDYAVNRETHARVDELASLIEQVLKEKK